MSPVARRLPKGRSSGRLAIRVAPAGRISTGRWRSTACGWTAFSLSRCGCPDASSTSQRLQIALQIFGLHFAIFRVADDSLLVDDKGHWNRRYPVSVGDLVV